MLFWASKRSCRELDMEENEVKHHSFHLAAFVRSATPALITTTKGLVRMCLNSHMAALAYMLRASHAILRFCKRSIN